MMSKKEKCAWVIGCVIVLLIFALAWWGVWSLYSWVAPQLWPTGPENLIRPGFFLFGGAWTLVGLLGRSLFGQRKD